MTTWWLAQAAVDAGGNDIFFIWGCVLFGIAVVLAVIEFFVPSGGLLGVLCGVAMLTSVVCFYRYDAMWGVGVGLAYVILTPIAIVFGFRVWLNSPIARTMILNAETDSDPRDDDEAAMLSLQERQARLEELRALIGAEGVAETSLRPVGTVRIGGERLDALAESGVIEAGEAVVVTTIYDNQIKVRAATRPGQG